MNERGDTRRKAEPMTKVPLLEDLLRGVDFDFILVLWNYKFKQSNHELKLEQGIVEINFIKYIDRTKKYKYYYDTQMDRKHKI